MRPVLHFPHAVMAAGLSVLAKPGVDMLQFSNSESSWPGLTRPSTPSDADQKDVDARIKSGHDDLRYGLGNSRPHTMSISP
jgi:hypothetical protein